MKKAELTLLAQEMQASVIATIDVCAAMGAVTPRTLRWNLKTIFKRERTSFNLAKETAEYCRRFGCKAEVYDHFRMINVVIDLKTHALNKHEAEYARVKLAGLVW